MDERDKYRSVVKEVRIVDPVADPAPLGLFAFGMSTVMLNFFNADIIGFSALLFGLAIAYGGFAQIVVGINMLSKNTGLGGVTFFSYGSFWWTIALIWLLPEVSTMSRPSANSMGVFFIIWMVFTIAMTIAWWKGGTVSLLLVFITLDILFLLLAIAEFTQSRVVRIVAGYEGIFCGCSAIYCGTAGAVNHHWKSKAFRV